MMDISSVNSSAAYTSEANLNIGPKKEILSETIDTSAKVTGEQNLGGVTDSFVQKSLERIVKAIQSPETTIDRSVHDVTKQVIYKVKDKLTGEVIRQFPEEKLVEAAAKLIELTGMMIDKKV
ncbi:flagellar protein FlaG [Paenibacillus sp. NPDC058174]|uniref:flagellar protein FlaG n=1 Tax=Paenibacillus sp. NPDC058174 TaxID=3346366 RepID=UPI0036DA9023